MMRGNLPLRTSALRTEWFQKILSSSETGILKVFSTTAEISGVTPPGMKSEYLFSGNFLAASVAGYQISVTSVRGSMVSASTRLESTKTAVVTPAGNGPGGHRSAVLVEAAREAWNVISVKSAASG